MNPFLALVPMLLVHAAPVEPPTIGPDGGTVPIKIPQLTPILAPALAPELPRDGGELLDGGNAPILVPESLSVYNVDIPAETAITISTFGVYVMVDLAIKPTLPGDLSCRNTTGGGRCDPADLSDFDRYAVGKSSAEWKTVSDVALISAMVAPFVYLGLESLVLPTKHPFRDYFTDILVIAESMALTAAMEVILKFAFRRPRPDRYLPDDVPARADDELSLPSGHVAMVAAATTALTTTVFLRHPKSAVRWVVLGSGVLFTALTAIGRVEAGDHFPTDVITAAFIGGFSGFVIPYFHKKPTQVTPTLAWDPKTGTPMLAISGSL